MPKQIVAVTNRFHLVILDAHTGKVIRTLARNVATFRGTPEIAVSPDGRQIYFTAIDDPTPGCATSGIETVFRVPRDGGTRVVVGRGRTVAVIGDGVAFSRDYENCASGPGALEIRGGPAARVRTEPPPDPRADELVLSNLSWSSDSAVLSFDWSREGVRDGVNSPYVLDAVTAATVGAARCLCRVAKGLESFGFLGRSHNLVAATPTGSGRQYAERVVVLRESGSVLETLFRWRAAIDGLESDTSGRHFVMVSPTKRVASGKTYIDVLYGWSKGDKKPTKIRNGITAAAWIPDEPDLIQRSVIASSLDRRRARAGDGVKFRIPTGDSRIEVRMIAGPLTLERRTGAGWQGVQSLEPFSTAFASRPNAVVHTVTIPSVPKGRYRLCASVSVRQSGAQRVGRTCRFMSVIP